MSEIARAFASQRAYQWTARKSSAADRRARLQRLKEAVLANAGAVRRALKADLRKPEAEAAGEVASVENDINDALAHLDEWMAPVEITPAPMFHGARARIIYEARGVCLVFGPWNFPFQLLFEPLVPVIAAGNTAILKPNELAPETSRISAQIVRQAFPEQEIAVFEGGVEVANELLALPVDHVFFTGSPRVGRVVMGAAARHLASVTLELGGKCPVIADATADLAAVAATVAAARCYNSGQVCLCPDIAWVPEGSRDAFVAHLRSAVEGSYYINGQINPEAFGRIVNRQNFDRVKAYLDDALHRGARVAFGGTTDAAELTIHPTVLLDVPDDARIMQEEIFGPILPVRTYTDPAQACAWIQSRGKPLALYVHSNDAGFIDTILRNTSSGGVTVNGWATHWFEPQLPFGGVNESGIGRYHGIHGFRELSHERAVFIQS